MLSAYTHEKRKKKIKEMHLPRGEEAGRLQEHSPAF